MKRIILFFSIFATLSGTCSGCSDKDGDVKEERQEEDTRSLKDAPYQMGCAVNVGLLRSNEQCRKLILKEMTSITPENAMKMEALSIGRGEYNWTDADYLVNFAMQNKMRIHGHTLLWHRALPAWVSSFEGDREAWIDLMKNYISDVVGHFKGKLASWDVVNEALEDDGTYRNTVWYEHIGKEYLDLAFKFAHEADPNVLLFYNDYGMEYSKAKRDAICQMIKDMKLRNIPVDGIGIQMHIDMYRPKSDFIQAIQAAAACGVKVHVSELDVATNPEKKSDIKYTVDVAERQKQSYKNMSEALQGIPVSQCYGLTVWGIRDSDSWLASSPDWPLLFDQNCAKKTSYYGLLESF